jgi:hypothetical protein
LLNAQNIARYLLQALSNCPAMLRSQSKNSQDQKVKRPLGKSNALSRDCPVPRLLLQVTIQRSLDEVQGETA